MSAKVIATAILVAASAANAQRTTEGLKSLVTFTQSGCATGTFAGDDFSSWSYNTTAFHADKESTNDALYKCPQVEADGNIFKKAHTGLKFSGKRGTNLPSYEFVKSEQGLSGLGITDSITVEMWLTAASLQTDNDYLLAEFGKSVIPDAATAWTCESGAFDFQLRVKSNKIYSTHKVDGGCVDIISDIVSLSSGKLTHLVVMVTPSVKGAYLTQYGQQTIGSMKNLYGPQLQAGYWTSTNSAQIGSSPATLSTAASSLAMFSWSGEIWMTAIYNRSLTAAEVEANFLAGPPNSAPVIANGQVLIGTEDEFSKHNLTTYDHDVEAFGKSDTISLVLASTVVDGSGSAVSVGGQLSATEAGPTLVVGQEFSSTNFFYKPTITNAYGGFAEFTVNAKDNNGALLDSPVKVTVNVEASNDDPLSAAPESTHDFSYSVPQTRSVEISLFGWDIDCNKEIDSKKQGLIGNATSSCEQFGLKSFKITSSSFKLGTLYTADNGKCNGVKTSPSNKITAPFEISLDSKVVGEQSKIVCFEGCLSGSTTNDCVDAGEAVNGVIGTDSFTYEVTDLKGRTASHSISIQVKSPLSAGETVRTHYSIEEDKEDFLEIQLKGIDYACDLDANTKLPGAPAACDTRVKEFVLRSIPPATQGYFYTAKNDTGIITEVSNITGLLLPSDKLYFRPAKDYFNEEYWPLCSDTANSSFSKCPRVQDSPLIVDDFKCAGVLVAENPKSCVGYSSGDIDFKAYTTIKDLEGNLVGNCDKETGCPVEVEYAVRVGTVTSTPVVAHNIWIANVHDTGALSVPKTSFTNVVADIFVPFRNGQECMKVNSMGEGDSRVLAVKFQVDNDVGNIHISSSINSLNSISFDPTLTGTNLTSKSVVITGTRTALNEQLCSVGFIIDKYSEKNAEITVEFQDVASKRYYESNANSVTVSKKVSISFKAPETPAPAKTLSDAALYGAIGGGSGFFLLAVLCCGVIAVRRAREGSSRSTWVAKNVFMSKVISKDTDDSGSGLQHNKVVCCGRLLPCLVSADAAEKGQSTVSVKKQDSASPASASAPRQQPQKDQGVVALEIDDDEIFDWEVHQHFDEKSGTVRNYYYNVTTGQSSWVKPSVKVKQ